MKTSNQAIHNLVNTFVTDLQNLFIADIIQSLAALAGAGNAATTQKLPKEAKPAARAKGAKRSPDELEALGKRLHAYVSKHQGQRIEQIAVGMGVTTKELTLSVKKLVAEKRLVTKGAKRATSYTAR
jgi:hypothetical protein